MAQTPILHDFEIALSHIDRGVDQKLQLKTPRHPSETIERLWLRVLAYCWQFEERLAFGPGLSDPDAPELFTTDLTGLTTLWMRVGKADPIKIQRAADQHPKARMVVLFESVLRREQFVAAAKYEKLARLGRVELATVPAEVLSRLALIDQRRAKLGVTIVEDHLYLELDGESVDGAIERGPVITVER
jgi:uncharacterized protein YaeQ